ncbi:hypothetical protein ACO0QE_001438 [Hanseniaspora vineae]
MTEQQQQHHHPYHNNALKASLNDLMKYSGDLLLQQQLKTIRLDPNVMNVQDSNHIATINKCIRDFHSILDNMDITLSNSQKFLATYQKQLVVKMEQERKEKELQEKVRKEQEELQRKQREEEEQREKERKKQEEEKQLKLKQENQGQGLVANASGASSENQVATNTEIQNNDNISNSNDLNNFSLPLNIMDSNFDTTSSSKMPDFGMDLSMFNTLDDPLSSTKNNSDNNHNANGGTNNNNNNPGLATFLEGGDDLLSLGLLQDPTNGSGNINNNGDNNNGTNNSSNNADKNNDDDQYLTLNDFNDLGIDWNSSEF